MVGYSACTEGACKLVLLFGAPVLRDPLVLGPVLGRGGVVSRFAALNVKAPLRETDAEMAVWEL